MFPPDMQRNCTHPSLHIPSSSSPSEEPTGQENRVAQRGALSSPSTLSAPPTLHVSLSAVSLSLFLDCALHVCRKKEAYATACDVRVTRSRKERVRGCEQGGLCMNGCAVDLRQHAFLFAWLHSLRRGVSFVTVVAVCPPARPRDHVRKLIDLHLRGKRQECEFPSYY
mmetsp:Transcript_11172/g.21618  ORF Transcript_11172/g.21618 Transcript_11172/m.21618 type:complete len:168 (+) Transcript_11172:1069-1572(+)